MLCVDAGLGAVLHEILKRVRGRGAIGPQTYSPIRLYAYVKPAHYDIQIIVKNVMISNTYPITTLPT